MSYFPDDDDRYDPPDGTYQVRVHDASAFTGRDGRDWAKVVLQIIGGDNAGRQFDHFMNLNNETGMRIARDALAMYGLALHEIENFGDLQDAMPELIGVYAEVSVRHKDGYRNHTVISSRTGRSDIPSDGVPEPKTQGQPSFEDIVPALDIPPDDDDDDDIPY